MGAVVLIGTDLIRFDKIKTYLVVRFRPEPPFVNLVIC